MIKLQEAVKINCDELKDDNCWEEIVIGFEINETVDDIMDFLRNMGWEFDSRLYVEGEEIKATCPWCGKRIAKQDQEIYMEEEDDNLGF